MLGCPRLLWEAVSQSLVPGARRAGRGQSGRERVRESGREASAAFPSQQVLVFGPGETASVRPVGWSSGLGRPVCRRERGHFGQAVSQSFLMGFEGDVRESGREASAAFPSQQVLAFGPGKTASVGPGGWSTCSTLSCTRALGSGSYRVSSCGVQPTVVSSYHFYSCLLVARHLHLHLLVLSFLSAASDGLKSGLAVHPLAESHNTPPTDRSWRDVDHSE